MGRNSGGVIGSSGKGGSAMDRVGNAVEGLMKIYGNKVVTGVTEARTKLAKAVGKLSDDALKKKYASVSENSWLFTNKKSSDYKAAHNRANRDLLKAYSKEMKKRKLEYRM